MQCRRIAMASLLAAGCGGALADEAALGLLDLMARSVRETSYSGVFTYEQGQALSSSRIVHAVSGGVEHERLRQLDGADREFLRIDHPLDCRHAAHRVLRSDGPSTGVSPSPELAGYYALELDGEERVASREGRRLRISPRDPYRYGMTLVLDAQSGLPLKAETTDGAGRVLERFQFVELEVGAPIGSGEVFTPEPGARVEAAHPGAGQPDAAPFGWSVSWLPAGFAESTREVRRDTEGRAVETRVYSDGLAVFTVFVEDAAADVASPGQASQGATVAYVTPRAPDGVVTVVGEIPVETARLVANAVSFAAP